MNVAPSGSFLATKPDFVPPPGSCDCHLHVFGHASQFSYAAARTYTPKNALPQDAFTMLDKLELSRAVIVQATPYGTNNSRLISALAEFPLEARGVVALDSSLPTYDPAVFAFF